MNNPESAPQDTPKPIESNGIMNNDIPEKSSDSRFNNGIAVSGKMDSDPIPLEKMTLPDGSVKFVPSQSSIETTGSIEQAGEDLKVGQEVTVRRNGKNGSPAYLQSGWKITEINGDLVTTTSSDGVWDKTYRLEDLLKYKDMPAASKYSPASSDLLPQAADAARSVIGEFDKANNERLREEVAHDIGETASEQVVEGPSPEMVPMSVFLNKKINLLLEKIPTQNDKNAVWQFAVAVTDAERNYALDKISPAVKSQGLHFSYKDLMVQLRKARVDEGILPPEK